MGHAQQGRQAANLSVSSPPVSLFLLTISRLSDPRPSTTLCLAVWLSCCLTHPLAGIEISELQNNYFTEICSGSEAGSYLRLIDLCITQL